MTGKFSKTRKNDKNEVILKHIFGACAPYPRFLY